MEARAEGREQIAAALAPEAEFLNPKMLRNARSSDECDFRGRQKSGVRRFSLQFRIIYRKSLLVWNYGRDNEGGVDARNLAIVGNFNERRQDAKSVV